MNQYFKYKIREEYLPDFIKEFCKKGVINQLPNIYGIYGIDLKFLRKLKLHNIENCISIDEKKLVEYLHNQDFVILLTREESDNIQKGPVAGKTGYAGVSGVCGYSGT